MKKYLFVLAFLGFYAVSNGYTQQLTPDVFAISGDFFANDSVSLSWSMGENISETFISASNYLTQGFQQPIPDWDGIEENYNNDQFLIYPNPCINDINIYYHVQGKINLSVKLYDVIGKLIIEDKVSSANTHHNIDISKFSSNCYFLSISDQNKILYSSIIIKQ